MSSHHSNCHYHCNLPFLDLHCLFIVNLTDVDYLNTTSPRMDEMLLENPWVGQVLATLSPLLLLIFNSGLLPIVLKAVSRLECPVSDSLLEASAFWKMATFTIIKTFL